MLNETPTRTRGETVELELIWSPASFGARGGYGDDYGTLYGVADPLDEYQAMVERLEWVDPIYTGVSHTGVPWVDERLPERAPVDTQILRVEPGSDVADVETFWGVLVGGEDRSRPPRGTRTISVELVYLAAGDQYSDRGALRADIGADAL